MLVDLKQKSQVTIPKGFVKKLNLKVGDKLEIEETNGKLIITPVVIVPKDQAGSTVLSGKQMNGKSTNKKRMERYTRPQIRGASLTNWDWIRFEYLLFRPLS